MSANRAYAASLSSLNWLGSQDLTRIENGVPSQVGGGRGGPPTGALQTAAATDAAPAPAAQLSDSAVLRFVEGVLKCSGLLQTAGGKRARLSVPLIAYSSFVFLVTALNLVRAAATLFGASADRRTGAWTPAERVLPLVWYAAGALTSVAFVASAVRRKGVRRFHSAADETLAALQAAGVRPTFAAALARPDCLLCAAAAGGATLASCGYAAYALLDDGEHRRGWTWLSVLFVESSQDYIGWIGRVVTLLASVYCALAGLWPSVYSALLARFVGRLHDDLARDWQASFVRNPKAAEGELPMRRRLHARVSALTGQFDALLVGWLLGLHQLCGLGSFCLAAHALWRRQLGVGHGQLPQQQAVVLYFVVAFAPLKLLAEILFAASIRSKAKKSEDVMYEFISDKMDTAVKAQIFHSQLETTRGFTACGMYRIQRSSAIKVLAFLAFAVILFSTSQP